jgi:hypothetical protein
MRCFPARQVSDLCPILLGMELSAVPAQKQ